MVFDRTCNEERRCYSNSGIKTALKQIRDKRIRLEYIDDRKFVPVNIKKGKVLKKWSFYKDALEADCYINVPVAKHHSLSGLSVGLKNIMGIIGGWRGRIHSQLGSKLADLNMVVRPELTIVDATRVIIRNGPQGGDLKDVKKLDTIVGPVDPFSLLVRGMVFSIDPIMNHIISGFFDSIYTMGPTLLSDYTEPIYEGLKSFIIPFKQSFFYLSYLSFLLLIMIFIMEFFGKRFWCRNLCPLGGLLALISRISIFKRIPVKACRNCELCESGCRMSAFDKNRRFMFEECNLCMDCLEFCPENITTFKFSIQNSKSPMDINRRQLIAAGLTGLVLPVLSQTSALSKMPDDDLIRPPGALDETDFLASCVRCAECMKVCINNALQPLFLEKGLDAMFTPKLVPRLGYCEFNCTLCSQVCPTGALERLSVKQKHAFVIGKAYFDRNKCLVYARKQSCIVCEEHCPTHDKAIKFNEIKTRNINGKPVTLKQPYVVEELCIGCGICEHICPIQGSAAIRVVGKGSVRVFQSEYA